MSGFNVYTETGETSSGGGDVDWEGRAKYLVETAELSEQETLVGVISGVIDLGIQPQEDGKMESNLSLEEEIAEMEKNPDCYFEDAIDYNDGKKEKRYKRFPVKDVQSVAISVDFPDIILDQAPFFGNESDPRPLRMLLGGEFNPKGSSEKIVARPIPLSIRKNDKTKNKWSFLPNHTLYKMAVAAKIISAGEPFLPQDIDKLVGKSMQFKAQLSLNEGKYLNEKCNFVGALARGQSEQVLDDKYQHVIQFTSDDNDADSIKELRASIKNTMKKATNWGLETTKLRTQLGGSSTTEEGDDSEEEKTKTPEAKTPAKKAPAKPKKVGKEPELEEDDDEDPFAE